MVGSNNPEMREEKTLAEIIPTITLPIMSNLCEIVEKESPLVMSALVAMVAMVAMVAIAAMAAMAAITGK